MTKFDSKIRKLINSVSRNACREMKKIIGENEAVIVNCPNWNEPAPGELVYFGGDAGGYVKTVSRKFSDLGPRSHFVSKQEIEEFKTVTWPKLRAGLEKNAPFIRKCQIRSEIARLEKELSEIDGKLKGKIA